MIVTNIVCAVCWAFGACLAFLYPGRDYRTAYIVAAFCLVCVFVGNAVVMGIDRRKRRRERMNADE